MEGWVDVCEHANRCPVAVTVAAVGAASDSVGLGLVNCGGGHGLLNQGIGTRCRCSSSTDSVVPLARPLDVGAPATEPPATGQPARATTTGTGTTNPTVAAVSRIQRKRSTARSAGRAGGPPGSPAAAYPSLRAAVPTRVMATVRSCHLRLESRPPKRLLTPTPSVISWAREGLSRDGPLTKPPWSRSTTGASVEGSVEASRSSRPPLCRSLWCLWLCSWSCFAAAFPSAENRLWLSTMRCCSKGSAAAVVAHHCRSHCHSYYRFCRHR